VAILWLDKGTGQDLEWRLCIFCSLQSALQIWFFKSLLIYFDQVTWVNCTKDKTTITKFPQWILLPQ